MSSSRSRSPTLSRTPSRSSTTAKRTKRKLVDRLYPAPAPVLDQVHRDRAQARHAAGLPHEPQPAVQRRDLGLAQAADGQLPADRRLRRALCRRDVPDDQGEADQGPCDRRAGSPTRCQVIQLRHAAGHLRRRLGRLVRGRLGADDERDGVLREGRDRAEGLGLDRHGRDRRRREVRRHQRPHQDQPDPLAPRRHVEAGRAHRHDATSPTTTRSASASSAIC